MFTFCRKSIFLCSHLLSTAFLKVFLLTKCLKLISPNFFFLFSNCDGSWFIGCCNNKKIPIFLWSIFSPFFLVFIEPNYTANFLLIMFNLCISIAILLKSPLWLNMKSCTCEFHQWFRTVALEVRNLLQKLIPSTSSVLAICLHPAQKSIMYLHLRCNNSTCPTLTHKPKTVIEPQFFLPI